jgi:hypothetical protein
MAGVFLGVATVFLWLIARDLSLQSGTTLAILIVFKPIAPHNCDSSLSNGPLRSDDLLRSNAFSATVAQAVSELCPAVRIRTADRRPSRMPQDLFFTYSCRSNELYLRNDHVKALLGSRNGSWCSIEDADCLSMAIETHHINRSDDAAFLVKGRFLLVED